ncbi:MAG TPA: glycosyltransferase [Bryobacteraceae bacterium]|nr:glycosyltransferase [Bryobacteraceae bacterium]
MKSTNSSEASAEQPSVTWLLSVKNSMPFLRETLESIHCQTYKNHKLLVWDDCSTDGTLEELERWIPNRIPGKIFSGRSLRLGPSLAFLVEQADTELCARIDGDDVNLPHRLERQVAFMQANPAVGVLGSLTAHIDENGTHAPAWGYPILDADIRWRSRWQPSLCHPTVMFRRSAVLAAGNYRDFQVEDFDLWMRMSLLTEFHNLPEPLVQYRRYSASLTGEVDDFYPLERKTASLNAGVLFINTADPAKAVALWSATHPYRAEQPNFSFSPFHALRAYRSIQQLRNEAIELARHVGKEDNYFTGSDFFKEQRYILRRRILQSYGPLKMLRLPAAAFLHRRKQPRPERPVIELRAKSVAQDLPSKSGASL